MAGVHENWKCIPVEGAGDFTVKKQYSKEELDAWREYDQSFDDDKGFEVESYKGLKVDDPEPLPFVSGVHNEHVLVGSGEVTNPNTCG